MEFTFKDDISFSTFKGEDFYNYYKNAPFLKDTKFVTDSLAKGVQLKQRMRELESGESLTISGQKTIGNQPLMIVKGNDDLDDMDITLNRFQGLMACHVALNSSKFPDIIVSIAKSNGFKWLPGGTDAQRLAYLSFTPGTHLFCYVFSYWPLAAALFDIHRNNKLNSADMKIYESRFRARDGNDKMYDLLPTHVTDIKTTYLSISGTEGLKVERIRTLIGKIWG